MFVSKYGVTPDHWIKKYKAELELDVPHTDEKELDQIIKDAMNLEDILKEEDNGEDY